MCSLPACACPAGSFCGLSWDSGARRLHHLPVSLAFLGFKAIYPVCNWDGLGVYAIDSLLLCVPRGDVKPAAGMWTLYASPSAEPPTSVKRSLATLYVFSVRIMPLLDDGRLVGPEWLRVGSGPASRVLYRRYLLAVN